ncbi:MAG: hypothetical protein ABL925_18510 [Methylococcales bacterium]
METQALQTRPETFINTSASKNLKTAEEKANQAQTDNSQNKVLSTAAETVTLSNESIKLATASINKTDIGKQVDNETQARQTLNQLLANFQSNPSQALSAQTDILPSRVKALLA